MNFKRLQLRHLVVKIPDNKDLRLLDMLYKNSQTKYADIADKLDLSVGSVHNRIKALKKERVIERFTIKVNPEALGYDLTALISMQIDVRHFTEVNAQLQTIPSLLSIYNTTGDHDIIAIGRFKNREALNNTLQRILNIRHIRRTFTQLCLQVLKEEWHVPHLGGDEDLPAPDLPTD